MTSAREGLNAAAHVLEEDIKKIDAGELKATAGQRAFLAGAVKGLKLSGGTESCTGAPTPTAQPEQH